MLFFRVVLLLFLVGCLPAEPIVDVVPEPDVPPVAEGKVPLSVEVRCVGLPTSSSGAFLGVQVDVAHAERFAPYAYGLFAGGAVPKIELAAGQRYRIVASWVGQGAAIGGDEKGFLAPFSQNTMQGTPVGEQWVYSPQGRMDKLTLGLAQVRDAAGVLRLYTRAPLTRYAAELSDFAPQAGKEAELVFERVTFDLSIAAPWLDQGWIEATISGSAAWILRPEARSIEVECTLIGHAERSVWSEVDYVDQFVGRAVWVRSDGSRTKLVEATFVVKKGERVEWGLQERK